MKLVVATHHGSGHTIVQEIVDTLGGQLVTVHSVEHAQDLQFDRLILLGGTDVDPFWYGEDENGAHGIDLDRDCIEWTLARRAIAYKIPTLGICRGHQMLTVASGGTLWQNIGYSHVSANHEITLHSDEFAACVPTTTVNSMHHQSVRIMPHGFTQVAIATKDKCCEAIYRKGYLGVQFHPEFMVVKDRRWLKMFQWFMEGLGMPDAPEATRTRKDVLDANIERLKKPMRADMIPLPKRKTYPGYYPGSYQGTYTGKHRYRMPYHWENEEGRWWENREPANAGAIDVKVDITKKKSDDGVTTYTYTHPSTGSKFTPLVAPKNALDHEKSGT